MSSSPKNSDPRPDPHGRASAAPLAAGAVVVALLGIIIASAPIGKLLGAGSLTVVGACHGASATLLLIAATVGLYLGYRLAVGRLNALRDLQAVSVATAILSLVTVSLGTRLYIPYRAPNGPRNFLVANYPVLHNVFFEFKEFIALFTLPLAVAAAYILLRYGESLLPRPWLRGTVALLLATVFLFLLLAFGLGAAITKVKAA